MNKNELVESVAQKTGISKKEAGKTVNAVIESITEALKKGENVQLVGFGTFAVSERAARTGRNPRTGETIEIKEAIVPKFRPGKALRDAVN